MAQELLISTSKENGFDVWDFATGQHIKAISAAKCNGNTALLVDPYTLLYSDLTKSYVHTTPVPVNASVSTTTSSSNSLPFPVSVVCSHPASGYFAGGSSTTGGCLLWDQTGNLVAQWNAHYKPISAMCFTGDGVFLCTGGEDAIIHIWLVGDLVSSIVSATDATIASFKPFTSFSSHTLAITSFFSSFSYLNTLYSSSKDNSIRLHDIASKSTLLTLLVPSPVHCVVVDNEQRSAFAACFDGNIYHVDLHKALRPMNTTGATFSTALNALSTPHTAMPGHSQSVLSLAFNFDCSSLASSSSDGTIRIWDSMTLTCIKTLSRTNRLSFNSLMTLRVPFTQATRKRIAERGIIRGKVVQRRDFIKLGGLDESLGEPLHISESKRFEQVMDDVKTEWAHLFCKTSPHNPNNAPSVITPQLEGPASLQQWQEAALQLYTASLKHIVNHSTESNE